MLAVTLTRTYRADVAGKVIVTVLPVAGLKTRPAEADSVVNEEPLVLPCIDSVCVRVPQPGGSFSTTRLTVAAAPRSTCSHCGNALLTLSQ